MNERPPKPKRWIERYDTDGTYCLGGGFYTWCLWQSNADMRQTILNLDLNHGRTFTDLAREEVQRVVAYRKAMEACLGWGWGA